MIKRDAENELRSLAAQFKAVAIIGPRQSGKTTLARYVFSDKPYINLENIDTRRFAEEDARGFLDQYPNGVLIDEAQRVPDLFSYLQQRIDEDKTPGKYILTGSSNFLLQEKITQSLAGRVAYLYLLPFSIGEIEGQIGNNVQNFIFNGGYPPIYDQPVEAAKWYLNYTATYIERDVRQISNLKDLSAFGRFLRLCAGRAGQLLNMNSLAMETGVDNKTISSWLGILESSFIVFRLQPHYVNFNKRVVKMPKLYFYDTGLLCSLLGIQNPDQLNFHPLTGNIFENMIVSEIIKYKFNRALSPQIYFWRDNTGHEVDVIIETATSLFPIEIKSGKTLNPEFLSGLLFYQKISGKSGAALIYGGDSIQKRSNGISVFPWNKVKNVWAEVD